MSRSTSRAAGAPLIAAVFAMGLLGLLALATIAAGLGPARFVGGVTLALLPLPLYVGLALWIDRYEKEPVSTLALAFLWGATVAAFLAVVLNTVGGALLAARLGLQKPDLVTAVVSAPIVEELAKGLALLALFVWHREEFDNVTDGIVYAAMVGLGFATTENVAYYGAALSQGPGESVAVFVLRGGMAPFSHPLFTAMFGAGLGLARESPGGARSAAPVIGLAAAVGLHALWNLSAALGAAFFVTYFGIMVPAFGGMIGLAYHSLTRERRILREHLASCVADGVLLPEDVEAICTADGRRRLGRAAYATGGLSAWRHHRRMLDAAGELAFHRWRRSRGLADEDGEAEAARLARLARLRRPPVAGVLAIALGVSLAAACGEAPREGREAGPAGPRPEVVGADRAARRPDPPMVAVAGRVVDVGSGEGLGDAYVIVLEPGVTLEEWEASAGEAVEPLMAAAVVTDSGGTYRIPALPRGHEYTVMIAARGYRSAVFENGLNVEPDAPALKTMEPVGLEPGVW